MSNTLKITTDNKPRQLMSWHDLPQKWQEWFDYLDSEKKHEPRFVHYKRQWHDAIDTQAITPTTHSTSLMGWALQVAEDSPLAKWHAVASDSFFSGLVFRFVEDEVIVGRYMA